MSEIRQCRWILAGSATFVVMALVSCSTLASEIEASGLTDSEQSDSANRTELEAKDAFVAGDQSQITLQATLLHGMKRRIPSPSNATERFQFIHIRQAWLPEMIGSLGQLQSY